MPLVRHLFASACALLLSLGAAFLLFSFLSDALAHPSLYFGGALSRADAAETIVALAGVVVSTLLAYVVYLLLTLETRADAAAWLRTRRLERAGEEFARLYESAPIPYLTLSQDGAIHRPNKAALRFFGADAEGLEGKKFFELRPEEDEDAARAVRLAERFRRGVPIDREEIRIATAHGVRVAAVSVFGATGGGGLVGIFDITDAKRLEESKSQFLSLASHQLKTPLASLKWHGELLADGTAGALSPKQSEYVEKIRTSTAVMIDLVDTLLNVSRLELGRLEPTLEPLDARELAHSVVEELAPQISQKRLEVREEYGEHLASLTTDRRLLRVVFQNLISNAVKYTPEGGSVRVAFSDTQIVVADTGIGIPEHEQARMFEKMFRAENARVSDTAGTGLGLFLTKSIVELLGGRISFVSKEGSGTTFVVKLAV